METIRRPKLNKTIKNVYRYNKTLFFSLVLTSIFFVTVYFTNKTHGYLSDELIVENKSILIGLASGLIGFILTCLSIFLGMPFEEIIKTRIKKYHFNIIIPLAMIEGILVFLASIIVALFGSGLTVFYIFLFFAIVGIFQTIGIARYVFILAIKRFDTL